MSFHWRGPVQSTAWNELQKKSREQYSIKYNLGLSNARVWRLPNFSWPCWLIFPAALPPTITITTTSTFTKSTSGQNREFDRETISQCMESENSISVESDTNSVDTTAATVFAPAATMPEKCGTERRDNHCGSTYVPRLKYKILCPGKTKSHRGL